MTISNNLVKDPTDYLKLWVLSYSTQLIKFDQIWTSLIKFDQVWSSLATSLPICTQEFQFVDLLRAGRNFVGLVKKNLVFDKLEQ